MVYGKEQNILQTEHSQTIDLLKGICAVFVIMLHSIPGGYTKHTAFNAVLRTADDPILYDLVGPYLGCLGSAAL